jgi:methylenetetrahydrofolate reductase (NADPH)
MTNLPVSFEFFPPKTPAGEVKLLDAAGQLAAYQPDFMSVTYGAAGSNRALTEDAVRQLATRSETPIMPHLTCVAHTETEVQDALGRYQAMGIDHILALAGDMPADGQRYESDFEHAEELVVAVKALGGFRIGVAAHPEGHPDSPDMASDRDFLARKLSLADFAVTQFFFDAEDYERLVDDLAVRDIDKPVLPGILPISNTARLHQMAALNNTSIPTGLAEQLQNAGDDTTEVEKIGVETASALADELLAVGAPGIHLYTMNRSDLAQNVLQNL